MENVQFDIYMLGVGGQGIGLLSESLIRAADRAGHKVLGVDTHGLAQRGGAVSSCLRLGAAAHSPLIAQGRADLVLALERNEAARGAALHLRPGGTLVYYDAVWQPLAVRMKKEAGLTAEDVAGTCARLGARVLRVFEPTLPDPRMQNMAVLKTVLREALIPGLRLEHVEAALSDLLSGPTLQSNLALLRG